jgi:hypothetical protein
MAEKPLVTDEVIEVAIPPALAAEFVREESWAALSRRGYSLLQFGTTDLGYWRIDGIQTRNDMGVPSIVATLRKVLLP